MQKLRWLRIRNCLRWILLNNFIRAKAKWFIPYLTRLGFIFLYGCCKTQDLCYEGLLETITALKKR